MLLKARVYLRNWEKLASPSRWRLPPAGRRENWGCGAECCWTTPEDSKELLGWAVYFAPQVQSPARGWAYGGDPATALLPGSSQSRVRKSVGLGRWGSRQVGKDNQLVRDRARPFKNLSASNLARLVDRGKCNKSAKCSVHPFHFYQNLHHIRKLI